MYVYAISKPSAALATFALYTYICICRSREGFFPRVLHTHTYLGDIQFMTKLHFTAVACPILVVYIWRFASVDIHFWFVLSFKSEYILLHRCARAGFAVLRYGFCFR